MTTTARARAAAASAGIEQVAVGERHSDVGDGRPIERQQLDLDRAAASPPDDVNAGSEHEAVQPGLEAIGIAEASAGSATRE